MITAILGVGILTMFCTMFYFKDRSGVGVYDPDPSTSYRYNNHKNK